MAEQAGDQIPSLPTDRSSDVSVIKMLVNGASAADLEMANGDEVAERADMPGPPPQNEVRRRHASYLVSRDAHGSYLP